MHSICQFSRRWHQQFCRSPSFVGHQRCLLGLGHIREYRQQPRSRKPSSIKTLPRNDVVVREFDQYGRDNRTRRPAKGDPLASESKAVRERLQKLEEELAVLRQGPFGPTSEFMQSLPINKREELLKSLEEQGAYQNEEDILLTDEELERIAEGEDDAAASTNSDSPLRVTLRVSTNDKVYVRHFNVALKAAKEAPEDLSRQLILWKWYLRCQQKVAHFSPVIPEDVWGFIWDSQLKLSKRPKHLIVLADDMIKAGVELDNSQWLEYIIALHADRDTATAIDIWEKQRSRLGSDEEHAAVFWTTGVEIYAASGRPQKAQTLAFESFEHSKIVGPEILAFVVRAWAESKNPSARTKLWFCYLEMRRRFMRKAKTDSEPGELLFGDVSENVLGRISSTLLECGQREMALAVFRDMINLQQRAYKDSWSIYVEALKTSDTLEDTTVHEDDVNHIGLSALIRLPKAFQNKFFFGSWIKWLIGQRKIDDAALVVELMQERGIKPDARHLNGIIGAWLRDSSPSSREKAERLAWAMVHARVELVKQQGTKECSATPVDQKYFNENNPYSDRRRLRHLHQREIPPATIETFSVLLLHFTRQSDLPKAEHLTEVLTGPANMKPNSFILNHWLYTSLRDSDLVRVWTRYFELKDDIKPDLETFAVLWDAAKINLDRSRAVHTDRYPSPRVIFSEMRSWENSLSEAEMRKLEQNFSRELYEQIIRAFCLSSDLYGTVCALASLRKSYNILPHEDITRMLIIQVARMLPLDLSPASKPKRPAIRKRGAAYQAALQELAGVVAAITENKAARVVESGADPAEVEETESLLAQEIRLDTLCTFICMILLRRLKPTGNIANETQTVAQVMGASIDMDMMLGYLKQAEEMK